MFSNKDRSDRLCCRPRDAGPDSGRRPPTPHAGNAPSALAASAPAATKGCVRATSDRRTDATGVFSATRITGWEVAARNRYGLRSSLRSASACSSTAVVGRSQARRHTGGTVLCQSTQTSPLIGRAAGHAVPALAGRGPLERGTRCARTDARARENGRSDSARRVPGV